MDRLSAINVILNLVLQFLPRIGLEVDPEPGRVALLEDHLVASFLSKGAILTWAGGGGR